MTWSPQLTQGSTQWLYGGNEKHKTQMKIEVLKNESRLTIKNSYTFKKPLPIPVTIGRLKKIQSPFDGF
jgi:hypothetical protein